MFRVPSPSRNLCYGFIQLPRPSPSRSLCHSARLYCSLGAPLILKSVSWDAPPGPEVGDGAEAGASARTEREKAVRIRSKRQALQPSLLPATHQAPTPRTLPQTHTQSRTTFAKRFFQPEEQQPTECGIQSPSFSISPNNFLSSSFLILSLIALDFHFFWTCSGRYHSLSPAWCRHGPVPFYFTP